METSDTSKGIYRKLTDGKYLAGLCFVGDVLGSINAMQRLFLGNLPACGWEKVKALGRKARGKGAVKLHPSPVGGKPRVSGPARRRGRACQP